MKPAAEGFSSKKFGKSLIIHFLKFQSSIYSRVILIIALLSVFLLISFSVIFSSVNEKYLNSIIHQNGHNIGSIVEGALYHSMLRNDKSELHNTLDIINSLSGIDEVNLYDNNDSLVYSSYAADATHRNNPDCIKCHRDLNTLFSWPDKTYRIINVKSACSMYAQENDDRFLLIRSKIMNERSCYTNACHAHGEDDIMLGSLIIKMPLAEFDKAVDQSSTRYFVFAILATVLLSSLLVVFTRKNIKKPLHDLVDASLAVTRGDRDKRLNTKHNQLDDMRMVSLAFNQMLDKLQAANTELENWSKQLEYKVQKKSEELSSVQNELIQIERIASLGKLSASVAHELNNPLSGILVYAKLISKQLTHKDLDNARKETMLKHLKLIETETKRCGDIVRGLLDFSRKDQSDYEPSHLHNVLRETYELMNHQMKIAGLSFIMHNAAREDLISCNPNQIKQACVALLVNAVEAVGPNGEIVMKTSSPDEQSIKLEIIDDGKGIAPENLPHIFEPFFSTKHEASGIGLGLAIVHGIIQSHKGSINVVSEPGKGTTIAITLPLIRKKEEQP